MADWFARLMQKGDARARRAIAGAGFSKAMEGGRRLDARDVRHDAVVRMLREREAEDREAREKRQLRYRQHLESEVAPGSGESDPCPPIRLYRFRTRVPCRVAPAARALLDQLEEQFSGGTVSFLPAPNGRQALMLTAGSGTEPKQIGWVEHSVETDPQLCNVRHQGLVVETDGAMLILRFRYPATAVRVSSGSNAEQATSPRPGGDGVELLLAESGELATVDFTEIRPALDLRPVDKGSSPRLVWVTRPEVETMNALASRDFEAFYIRFKLEVQAGIWSALSGLLSSSPGSQWHLGAYYTVVRDPDGTNGRIYQKTVDDSGRIVDIGLDRIYDASAATDILLLYLGEDILADIADIYFTLQSLGTGDGYFVKEEFFTGIRQFWAGSHSLASRYGSELAAVVRMAQRTVPAPAQAPLLREDWTNLRQSLVDRYGKGGRNAADLVGQDIDRPHNGPAVWPFASFPAGEVNIGLRVIYRQEWTQLGARRGEVLRTVPSAPKPVEAAAAGQPQRGLGGAGVEDARVADTRIEPGDTTRKLNELVSEAARAAATAMKWPAEVEGSINTGVRGLAAATDMGVEAECRESSRETGTRLTELMRRMAARIHEERKAPAIAESTERSGSPPAGALPEPAEPDAATCIYSRLQNEYEILTRPAEIQNVVLVAERLPAPGEIDLSWVKRHDWILGKVLLDESFRDALASIAQEARSPDPGFAAADGEGTRDDVVKHVDTFSGTARLRADGVDLSGEWTRGYRDPAGEQLERLQRDLELDAARDRLYEHLRTNILHYQRAIWAEEDPHQRSMRYRKSGRMLPLEWRFELESGGSLTIEELSERLGEANVDGQFAAYSGGREAELDHVIDPAGPVAFYGNYAVYRMRPEFGSEDLFAPLHFFKSPYLQPNAETGEAEVADPAEIQLSDDPTVFRRERARRIALDSDGVVIDVVRSAESRPEAAPVEAGTEPLEVPEGFELILNSGRGIELVSPNGRPDPEGRWLIVSGGDAMERLVAGPGGAAAAETDDPLIVAEGPAAGTVGLHAGSAADPAPAPALAWDPNAERALSLPSGRSREPEAEPLIVARSVGAVTVGHLPGANRGDDPEAERVIPAAGGGTPTVHLLAGTAGVHGPEAGSLIFLTSDGALLAGAGAASPADPQAASGILTNSAGAAAPGLTSGGGVDAGPHAEAVEGIVAGREEWLRPTLVAG